MGFALANRPNGPMPTVSQFTVKSGTTDLSGGVIGSLHTDGTVKVAVTNDTQIVGLVLAPVNPKHSLAALPAGAVVEVITDPDAVYRVTDANARQAGAKLDLATGAKALAASSNNDLVVVAGKTAAEPTLVQISQANHFLASS